MEENKKFFTYVLYSEVRNRLYIGQTEDLPRRIEQHNTGKVSSTKPYRPYKLIYFEESDSRIKAMKREKDLKTSKGRVFVKTLI